MTLWAETMLRSYRVVIPRRRESARSSEEHVEEYAPHDISSTCITYGGPGLSCFPHVDSILMTRLKNIIRSIPEN